MSIKGVCFDLDGTLLDTLADLADSMNRTLERHGLPTHPVEAYKTFVGNGLTVLVRRAAPAAEGDDDLARQLIDGMRAEYAKRWAERTRPYDGVPEMLNALEARGVAMGILSNKPNDFTELCVAELLPHWKFQVVLGVSETTPAKPDPTGLKNLCSEMGLDRSEFLYVGDTNTDVETAKAGGLVAVGVLWGFRGADELTAAGADTLIAHPVELLELL